MRNCSNLFCFSEGKKYSIDKYEILRKVVKNAKIATINGKTFSFIITGFLVVDNNLIVVFPKNYNIPDSVDHIKKEASILLKTLMKYRMEKLHSEDEASLMYGGEGFSASAISNAVFIVTDYVNNGVLVRNTKFKSDVKSGRINWNATINKTVPFINHNRPVYISPIMDSKVVDAHNMITQIHRYIANECISQWGWLMGYEINPQPCKLPVSAKEAVSLLKKELSTTYVQRDTEVIKAMIGYLEDRCGEEYSKSLTVLATPYFYYVWESICGYIFENNYIKLSSIIPQPVWKSTVKNAAISQRPDILFVKGDTFYILDAKYYNYNKNLPGWHDVVKQMFYKYSIEKALKHLRRKEQYKNINEIANIFVLPDNSNYYIRYLGIVEIEQLNELGQVHAFSINTKKAMESYSGCFDEKIKNDFLNKYQEELAKACHD